ncbi:Arm DNA-binding domain-containing protein [Kitasatospora sp. NPDC094019]|uniref:Arm DNA-binding domain-containing protein n=1 Tax=Kitasatospora sp. NPDC094019 TaxID=3364091 RepID=UPI0038191A29
MYRRCVCTDGSGKQLGPWCPRLAGDLKHGRWTYCVDLAPEDGNRKTHRRGGFATRAEATRKMKAVLNGELRGVYEDRRTTVASFLQEWLTAKKEELARTRSDGFAPPGLSVDAHQAGPPADVFSLGQLIGWVLTGEAPSPNIPLAPVAGSWRGDLGTAGCPRRSPVRSR